MELTPKSGHYSKTMVVNDLIYLLPAEHPTNSTRNVYDPITHKWWSDEQVTSIAWPNLTYPMKLTNNYWSVWSIHQWFPQNRQHHQSTLLTSSSIETDMFVKQPISSPPLSTLSSSSSSSSELVKCYGDSLLLLQVAPASSIKYRCP
jgi:hypothetical protein